MRSRLTVPVVCSECGKELRGTPMGRNGFRVRSHKRGDGRPCLGTQLLFTHKPATIIDTCVACGGGVKVPASATDEPLHSDCR